MHMRASLNGSVTIVRLRLRSAQPVLLTDFSVREGVLRFLHDSAGFVGCCFALCRGHRRSTGHAKRRQHVLDASCRIRLVLSVVASDWVGEQHRRGSRLEERPSYGVTLFYVAGGAARTQGREQPHRTVGRLGFEYKDRTVQRPLRHARLRHKCSCTLATLHPRS